jgi:hypothetical protein
MNLIPFWWDGEGLAGSIFEGTVGKFRGTPPKKIEAIWIR